MTLVATLTERLDNVREEVKELKRQLEEATLLKYEERAEFIGAIKKAKGRIEAWVEEQLFNREVPIAGVIFNLTNNYGWRNP